MIPLNFRAAGLVLYGPAWQFRMADALGVSPRTINRWAKGERPIPDGIEAEIRSKLVPAQIEALKAL